MPGRALQTEGKGDTGRLIWEHDCAMDAAAVPDAYLLYAWIRDIHPLLWRRFLVRADSTLADLHWVFQIAFGWTDFHLHRFRIRRPTT